MSNILYYIAEAVKQPNLLIALDNVALHHGGQAVTFIAS